MYSIKEVAEKLHLKPHILRQRIKKLGLGTKVGGWTIILTEEDLQTLQGHQNGCSETTGTRAVA